MEKICFTRILLLLIHGAAAADVVLSKIELGRLLKIANWYILVPLYVTFFKHLNKALQMPFPILISQTEQVGNRMGNLGPNSITS